MQICVRVRTVGVREGLKRVDLCEGEDSWREGGLEMGKSV